MTEVLDRHRLPTRPVVGLTICYSYLWHREHRDLQREEGLKYRPCVIVLSHEAIKGLPGRFVAEVVPVSHSRQYDPDAVEIPPPVKRRMGLDMDHSWIITTEINRFIWPGPDLHPARHSDNPAETEWHWGVMATDVFRRAKEKILARRAARSLLIAPRSGK
jgi:hypothetical protein